MTCMLEWYREYDTDRCGRAVLAHFLWRFAVWAVNDKPYGAIILYIIARTKEGNWTYLQKFW